MLSTNHPLFDSAVSNWLPTCATFDDKAIVVGFVCFIRRGIQPLPWLSIHSFYSDHLDQYQRPGATAAPCSRFVDGMEAVKWMRTGKGSWKPLHRRHEPSSVAIRSFCVPP